MHLRLLGTDHRPSAFGLDPAHGRFRIRPHMAEAIAVRHLIEPVLRCLRPDLDRLEQNVVTRIARHIALPQVSIVVERVSLAEARPVQPSPTRRRWRGSAPLPAAAPSGYGRGCDARCWCAALAAAWCRRCCRS